MSGGSAYLKLVTVFFMHEIMELVTKKEYLEAVAVVTKYNNQRLNAPFLSLLNCKVGDKLSYIGSSTSTRHWTYGKKYKILKFHISTSPHTGDKYIRLVLCNDAGKKTARFIQNGNNWGVTND
tara:strand:- start:53 stop:421 length:369 start_codon:yes stop_codon:yes gene_type:complete